MATNRINGIYDYVKSGTHYHVCCKNFSGYNSEIFIYSSGSWLDQNQRLADGAEPSFATFLGYLFIANDNDACRSYDGTTWSTSTNVTDMPVGKYLAVYNNRLYIANTSEGSCNVERSSLPTGTAITWDDDIFEVDEDDGDEIQWIGVVGNRLIILKEYSIHSYDGNIRRRIADVGTPSPYSVCEDKGILYFYTREGIMSFDGSNLQRISDDIEDIIEDTIKATVGSYDTANVTYDDESYIYNDFSYESIIGDVDNFHYIMYLGNLNKNNIDDAVLDIDVIRGSITLHSVQDTITAMGTYQKDGENKLYFGTLDGEVFEWDKGYDDDGVAISTEVITKDYNCNSPEIVKQFNWINVFSDTAGYNISYCLDRCEDYKSLGYVNKNEQLFYFPNTARGQLISFKITDSDDKDPWNFNGFVLDFDEIAVKP